MGILLLQILQWVLRIILFLLLLLLGLIVIVLIVPIRYQVEGKFLEKKPGGRGKITWFFYLVYMSFVYEEDFRIQVRVFGFKVFDSANKADRTKKNKEETPEKKSEETRAEPVKKRRDKVQDEITVSNKNVSESNLEEKSRDNVENNVEIKESVTQNTEQSRDDSQTEEQNQSVLQDVEESASEKERKSLSEKIEDIKLKIQGIIQKIKDIISKIEEGKLKVEHYLELWNRKETRITFSRARKKLGKMIKAVLPGKWKVTGEIGFDNPAATGQLMGALGAMYPILGNKVQIVPNFENEVINIEGSMKGHIRLGNLLYQLVSLILNRHCFKFIKLILDELGSSKKGKKET